MFFSKGTVCVEGGGSVSPDDTSSSLKPSRCQTGVICHVADSITQ